MTRTAETIQSWSVYFKILKIISSRALKT